MQTRLRMVLADQELLKLYEQMFLSREFEERCAEYEKAWKHNEFVVSKLRNAMENAMLKAKFDRVGELSLNIEQAAMSSGEAYGIMSEAKRYLERANPISRQEFERVSAKAQLDGEKLHQDVFHCGGKCEYVWNIWRQTGRLEGLPHINEQTYLVAVLRSFEGHGEEQFLV